MRKAIFWDFDGTLAHAKCIWTNSVYKMLQKHYPCAVDIEQVRPYLKTCFPWHDLSRDNQDLISDGVWWRYMEGQFARIYRQLGVPQEVAVRVSQSVRGEVLDIRNHHLYADTLPVLAAAKDSGFRQYIISNNYPELPEIMEKLGVLHFFDGLAISACVGYDKPRKEIYQYALELAGELDFCCAVGDNPKADVAGAKSVGLPVIQVHNLEASRADAICRTLWEVWDMIQDMEIHMNR